MCSVILAQPNSQKSPKHAPLSFLHKIWASISSVNKLRIPQLPSFQRDSVKIDQLMFEEHFQDEQLFKSPIYEADP